MKYLIFDSETTGLNIITDKLFLLPWMLVDKNLNEMSRGMLTDAPKDIQTFINMLTNVDTLVGHNIKFDVHMCINAGVPIDLFKDKNYIDTAVLARLTVDADKQDEATFSTALKKLAVRFLGVNAADEERKLKAELSLLVQAHKAQMREYFAQQGLWDLTWSNTESTKYINEVYNNWEKVYHRYPQLKQARDTFLKMHPAPTYQDVSNVTIYAMTDVVLTHKLLQLFYPKIVTLQQVPTLKRISAATFPLILMERKGMVVDLQQVLKDRNIIVRELKRVRLIDPRTNEELSIGQHAKLKEVYEYESGMLLNSADKDVRAEIEDLSPTAKKANYIAKLDKYLSTYITRILRDLLYVDNEYKVFTQYNMAGTVTGRLSSNFQQFPKEAIELETGDIIDVRAWFIVPSKDKYMFYFDYSQMELRLQCEWTNIVNGQPDVNLARAFIPYRCYHYQTKQLYVDVDPYGLRPGHPQESIEDCLKQGWSIWLDPITQDYWKPADLHALTAMSAFPNIKLTDPDWSHYRQLGKRANFACNYGASAAKIAQSLKVDFKTAKALVDGYRKTFAGVVQFGKWLAGRTYTTSNTPNLLLRRYYSRNKHKLQNWLVQGSGADILLLKTREIYDYIKNKPHWNLMLSVHDEVALTCTDIPLATLKKEVVDIQQLMTHKMSAVDIVVDVEYTTTNWSAKEEWT
jgi:DNA polymerase-1